MDPSWPSIDFTDRSVHRDSFEKWQQVVLRQIVDLAGMRQTGELDDNVRYFGKSAPRSGLSWFNFDPITFLECGVEGSVGGWCETMEASGRVALGESAGRDEVELSDYGWAAFTDLLEAGQMYE